MEEKNLKIKLSSIYFIVYGVSACFSPFWMIYFKDAHMSYTEIGIAFAIISMVTVITQPIWGYITDKYSNKRHILMVTMVLSSIFILLFIFKQSFKIIVITLIAFFIFQSPVLPVTDAYGYEIINQNKDLVYGRLRLMGSASYAVIALGLGYVMKYTGLSIGFITYTVMTLIGVAILKSVRFRGRRNINRMDISDIKKVITDKRFLIFLISIAVINISQGANANYLAVLIQKTGGGVEDLGIMWFIIAISELPLFFCGQKFVKRYGELNIYLLATVLYIVRYLLSSFSSNYITAIIVQAMQGITFPLLIVSTFEYLNKILPPKMRTSGMTLYTAVGTGLGAFIGNITGGILLENITIFALYRIIAITCVLCLFIILYLKKVDEMKQC